VLEVTPRSAANLLDIHPNTADIFYKQIRQIISFHLALQTSEVFDGCIEPDERYFGGVFAKGKNYIEGIENF
jgi:transposase